MSEVSYFLSARELQATPKKVLSISEFKLAHRLTRENIMAFFAKSYGTARGAQIKTYAVFDWVQANTGLSATQTFTEILNIGGLINLFTQEEKEGFLTAFNGVSAHTERQIFRYPDANGSIVLQSVDGHIRVYLDDPTERLGSYGMRGFTQDELRGMPLEEFDRRMNNLRYLSPYKITLPK